MAPSRMRRVPRETADIDRHVYRSDLVAIGAYRCAPDHARFAEPGPVLDHCIVFPRTPSVIEPDGHPPFVGDQNTISIYNTGQRFRRRRLTDAGDVCDYFAVAEPALRDVIGAHDPSAAERGRVFIVSHAPGDPALYLRQRRLFRLAAGAGPADHLDIDEQVLWLFDAVARATTARTSPRAITARHRELVEAAKAVLARRCTEPVRLAALARAVGSSPFHLCRVFRAVTGTTIHQHHQRLRLAAGLTRLEDGGDLTALALDLGYSSHSHFTDVFRRAYGVQPGRLRRWLASPARPRRRRAAGA